MTLKDRTISGLIWSFIDNFSKQGITFVVGIILARLLTPREFGLIGMTTIFIAISQSFVDSGFSQALIRKKDCTQTDYSTVFYFNLVTAIFFYAVLYFSAGAISRFFDEPQLKMIVQVLGLGLIINAFTIIQRTRLTKRIDFKLQTKISIIAVIGSGTLGIIMAYQGYGVWSLVTKTLAGFALTSLLLWIWNGWMPSLVFSKKSFREMFAFGSRLLASGLIHTAYQNIYYLVIGKFFSAQELGYYTRAQLFKDLPAKNMNNIILRVTYPVLALIQDDPIKLKAGYKKIVKSVMYIIAILMIGLAVIAEPLIIILIGENWRPAILYLQLLTFVGLMYPLNSLNLNMLKVLGHSNLFLKVELLKKLFAIPVIIVGLILGMKALLMGMWINTIIAYVLNSFWSKKFLDYSIREQINDILPGIYIAVTMGLTIYLLGIFLPLGYSITLILQVFVGFTYVMVASEIFKVNAYWELKRILLKKTVELKLFKRNLK